MYKMVTTAQANTKSVDIIYIYNKTYQCNNFKTCLINLLILMPPIGIQNFNYLIFFLISKLRIIFSL